MKKSVGILCLAAICSLLTTNVFSQFNSKTKVSPFRLGEVRLLESPFKRAMELDAEVLLKIRPDRLLHNFRKNAGLEPKDKIYGGWESREIAGHTLGHYLTALAMHYASTGDKRFLERVEYIVDELAECQSRDADGYVSGIPDGKRIFGKLAEGRIVVKGPHNFDEGWVPWYTMHKLFAGLLDANEFAGSRKALKVVIKLADWADKSTQNLTDEQIQKILSVEHGGMLETFVDLAARTGDKKYLKLSERFYHKAILDPLAENQILILEGKHANTQVPKILGAARLFEIGGDPKGARIAENFWTEVVHHYTYANGGNSDREVFGKRDELAKRMSGSMTETCNTYNMLKLTRHLFEWNPRAALFDYYERALYNQILASQDPQTGLSGYKLGLYGGYFQPFSTLEDSFWCCTGSGFENHVKYNDSIYFQNAAELYVNLFIPSVLNWKAKNLTLRQETKFPDAETVALNIDKADGSNFALKIRRPVWSQKMTVAINGRPFAFEDGPDGYISLSRRWKKGDRVEIRLLFALKLEKTPDDPQRLAILYGPVVLAGLLGTDNFPPGGPYGQEGSDGWKLPLPKVPQLAGVERSLDEWIRPVDGRSLTFTTFGANGEPLTLVPLFRSQHQRMTVYWDAKQ
jgi:uncharacterized protein